MSYSPYHFAGTDDETRQFFVALISQFLLYPSLAPPNGPFSHLSMSVPYLPISTISSISSSQSQARLHNLHPSVPHLPPPRLRPFTLLNAHHAPPLDFQEYRQYPLLHLPHGPYPPLPLPSKLTTRLDPHQPNNPSPARPSLERYRSISHFSRPCHRTRLGWNDVGNLDGERMERDGLWSSLDLCCRGIGRGLECRCLNWVVHCICREKRRTDGMLQLDFCCIVFL